MTVRLRFFISILLFTAAAGAFSSAGAALLRIKGSSTMKVFGDRLADWYAQKNPSVQFDVAVARPSESFAAMAAGKAEIVQSSRRVLRAEEEAMRSSRGKKYFELPVATEIAGIAVNAANPVQALPLFDLRQVLSGNVKNWKQVGGKDAPIVIYGRDDRSGVRDFLEEEFMGVESISSSAKTFSSNRAMFDALAHDPGGIAFGTVESAQERRVRFLGIKPSSSAEPVAPDGEAIRSKRYKLIRPLFFYFAGQPEGNILRFAQWVLSPEGQLVVESAGYYPLSSAEREDGLRALRGN